MTTGLSVTITQATGGKLGGSRRSEVVEYSDLLERLQQLLVSTQATSGTITDRNGGANLTYTYTPVASA